MTDLVSLASGLEPGPDGIWYARRQSKISYPEEGNQHCLALEEDSFWFAHRNDCILALMRRFPPPGVLLDVGGGNGYVAAGLQRAGIPVALLEPGRQGVLNARRRGVQSLICATLADAEFAPGSLPAVGMFDVLEHFAEDEALLRSVSALLALGGRLYLSVPAYGVLWSTEDSYAGHHRRYTLGGLARRLAAAGLRPLFASYFFSMLPLPILLLRAVPSRLGQRRPSAWDRYHREHRPRPGAGGRLLTLLLRWELARLRAGKAIPLGGSCLVAAEKIV